MIKPRPALFKWRHFDAEVIVRAVRWYLRSSLSSYPRVIAELKRDRKLGRRCRCRTGPYLNNVVEQDKRRVNASQGFRSFDGAWRTIQGYEVLHMIRERPIEVVAEKGRAWVGSVHSGNPRTETLNGRSKKRRLSAAGQRAIIEATKRRWAALRKVRAK
jgi:transposase-like protein